MFYIDYEGKTVLRATCVNGRSGDIKLDDGRVLREHEYKIPGRIFATDPDTNPNIVKDDDGVYHWKQKYPCAPGITPAKDYSFFVQDEGGDQ